MALQIFLRSCHRLWQVATIAVLSSAAVPSTGMAACTPSAPSSVSFEDQIQPILNARCVMCHVTGAANAGLNMEPGLAYGNLVDVASTESGMKRIAPGDPDASYLVNKLRGTQVEVGGFGDDMPIAGGPLKSKQIDMIVSWVMNCAPEN